MRDVWHPGPPANGGHNEVSAGTSPPAGHGRLNKQHCPPAEQQAGGVNTVWAWSISVRKEPPIGSARTGVAPVLSAGPSGVRSRAYPQVPSGVISEGHA
jgi:hypothetical protein